MEWFKYGMHLLNRAQSITLFTANVIKQAKYLANKKNYYFVDIYRAFCGFLQADFLQA